MEEHRIIRGSIRRSLQEKRYVEQEEARSRLLNVVDVHRSHHEILPFLGQFRLVEMLQSI